jgi:hypothetical protein
MNIVFWVLQVLLALHTAMGAVWKFSNSSQSVPSLSAIPVAVWQGLSVLELVCSLGLVLPAFYKPLAWVVPLSAACIAAEMLIFCAVHLRSSETGNGPMVYWLVVAALCSFTAYGRFVLKPF